MPLLKRSSELICLLQIRLECTIHSSYTRRSLSDNSKYIEYAVKCFGIDIVKYVF